MITKSDLKKTEQLARAATPGPWETYPMGDPSTNQNRNRTTVWQKLYPKRSDQTLLEMTFRKGMDIDAEYLSHMHPGRTLEMVEEIRSLRAQRFTYLISELEKANEEIRSLEFCLENKSQEIGRSEHRGNTVDYIYDKLALYSKQLGNVVQERDKANEELKNLREWNSDLEEQNGRVAIKNQLLEGKIATLEFDLERTRGLLEEALIAAEQMRTGLRWASMQFLSEQYGPEMYGKVKAKHWQACGDHIDGCLKAWDAALAKIRASRGEK